MVPFDINNTPLSALRSIADKEFLRVVSQCAYSLIQSYTTYCSAHIYILNVLHIVRSPPIANGSVRQANLTVMMSMERREWFKRRRQTEASLAGKLNETLLKPKFKFHLPGYDVYKNDRLVGTKGGVAILVKKGIIVN